MPSTRKVYPSPRRFDVDLSQLEGATVLGEPLALLFSGLLRLSFSPPRDGLMEMSATLPRREADALEGAMARAERKVPGDRRTRPQRDGDRFLTVAERVFEAVDAMRAARAQQLFRR